MATSRKANNAADFFKSLNNQFSEQFSKFSAPSVDFNEFFNVGRRNMEAYSAANQALIEGAQAINKRSAEVMQNNIERCLSASREMMSSKSPETNTAKQSEVAKDVFETCVSSAREISEMASKSAFEAFDVINKRCAEAMEETSQLAKRAA